MLKRRRHNRTGFARVIAILALVAIAARALVPAGYMVGPSERGQLVSIVLCSGHAAVLDLRAGRLIEPGQTPADKQNGPDRASDAPCVFAAAAQLATPEAAPEAPAPLFVVVAQDYQMRAITPGRGLAAPPPWATGPPLTV